MAQVTQPSRVIIVAGPTASGKSDYALSLARQLGGEIINADSAQMYTRISIGTAKPLDWHTSDVPHHLYDVCDQPVDFDVVRYRDLIISLVNQVQARGKVPILVGGSLFYIKSLLFPPHQQKSAISSIPAHIHALPSKQLWDHLQSIDPDRAAHIHLHDTYRIMRALAIWYDSGQKPSTLVPRFEPPFMVKIIFMSPPVEELYARINQRTVRMINELGWVDEVRDLLGDSAWRLLIEKKGFIGYSAIIQWLEGGALGSELAHLIAHIQQDTRNYAKRQRTFWRSFVRQLELIKNDKCVMLEIKSSADF